jgi:23S rRNA G2445 N2-methylase RlmL
MKQYQFIAKTLAGLEEALAQELILLGAQEVNSRDTRRLIFGR